MHDSELINPANNYILEDNSGLSFIFSTVIFLVFFDLKKFMEIEKITKKGRKMSAFVVKCII